MFLASHAWHYRHLYEQIWLRVTARFVATVRFVTLTQHLAEPYTEIAVGSQRQPTGEIFLLKVETCWCCTETSQSLTIQYIVAKLIKQRGGDWLRYWLRY